MPLPEFDFGAPSHTTNHAGQVALLERPADTEVSITQVSEETDVAIRHGEAMRPEHDANRATQLGGKAIDTIVVGKPNFEG